MTRAALDPRVLLAAGWALHATRRARRQLRTRPLQAVRLPAPPALPASAGRGVDAVLRRLEPSCLERSLVRQRWLAAHGERRVIVVGVSSPSDFRAHAWLEGERSQPVFHEIARIAP